MLLPASYLMEMCVHFFEHEFSEWVYLSNHLQHTTLSHLLYCLQHELYKIHKPMNSTEVLPR